MSSSFISPAPTAIPEEISVYVISRNKKVKEKEKNGKRTSYELDQPPEPEKDEQADELLFSAAEDDLEDERRDDHEGVEAVEAGHRVLAREREVEGPAEGPDVQRDFEEEDGGDGEGEVREDGEPGGLGLALGIEGDEGGERGEESRRRARAGVVGEKGVDEVGEHAGGVDDDLHYIPRARSSTPKRDPFRENTGAAH